MRLTALLGLLVLFGILGPLAAQGDVKTPGGTEGPAAAERPDADPPPALNDDDPLGDVTQRMGTIATDLAQLDTGKSVRTQQSHVVSHLDELIERLRRKRGG